MLFDGIARRALGQSFDEAGGASPKLPAPAAPRIKIGLALGGGAARGWAHIGVLQALNEAGIRPDIITGCSIGAVVGGCYAAGKLGPLEVFARSLTRRRILGLLDFHIGGSGLIGGDRLRKLLEMDLGLLRIEDLPARFAAVATELGTGHEVWLTRGSLVKAMRASYALPGVFEPVRIQGRLLMDGALVNPVPVTLARAFEADLVICVNLNGDVRVRGTVIQAPAGDEADTLVEAAVAHGRLSRFLPFGGAEARRSRRLAGAPGVAGVMIDAFNIAQDRISRSRLAGDPPDIMIAPKLAPVGLFEFHRAAECIDLGHKAAERMVGDIRMMIGDADAALNADQAVAM